MPSRAIPKRAVRVGDEQARRQLVQIQEERRIGVERAVHAQSEAARLDQPLDSSLLLDEARARGDLALIT